MLSTLLHLCLEPPFHFFYSCVQDGYRDHHSPTYFDESETEETFRVFVALFDYDPLSMSPNPDAADEELPFKEGQIIRVGFLKKNNKIF